MATQTTSTLELTPEEVKATLNALDGWEKHLKQLLGALPIGRDEREAVASVRARLMAIHYGPKR